MQLHAFVVLRFVQADIDPPLKRKEVTKEAEKEAGCNKPEAQNPDQTQSHPLVNPTRRSKQQGVCLYVYILCVYIHIYIYIY